MRTGTVDRARLIKAVGGDVLVARQLENLTSDVTETLPDMSGAAQAAADAAQKDADEGLSRIDALALGVFGQRPAMPLSVRPGNLIEVATDAGGFVVSVDVAQLAVAVSMLLPKRQPQQPDEVQAILAARTFNRR